MKKSPKIKLKHAQNEWIKMQVNVEHLLFSFL